jgi:hypothetical protein
MTGNDLLLGAIDKLTSAAETNSLLACAEGLRAAINASGMGFLDPKLTAEFSRLLFAVAPRIADLTSGRLAVDHVFTALGCMNGALSTPDPERFLGLLTFAALLESELRVLCFHDAIITGSQADLALAIAQAPLAAPVQHAGPIITH